MFFVKEEIHIFVSMKHSKLLFIGLLISFFTAQAAAQSYSELYKEAITAIEQDSLLLAEDLLKQALKAEPANRHNIVVFSNLGTVQRRLGNYKEAIESYNYALNIDDKSIPTLLNRASLYLEIDNEKRAYTDYSDVLDLNPENEEALFYQAYLAAKRDDYKIARDNYNRLLSLNSENKMATLGLALLEQKEKHYNQLVVTLNGKKNVLR